MGKVFTDPPLSAWKRDVVRPDWVKLMDRLESGMSRGSADLPPDCCGILRAARR